MIEKIEDNKQTDLRINHLYGITLVALVKGMKQSLANQRIKECMTALLEMGYSKQELIEQINIFLKDE